MNENRRKGNFSYSSSPWAVKYMGGLGAVAPVALWMTIEAVSKEQYHFVLGLWSALLFAIYFICILKSMVDIRKDIDGMRAEIEALKTPKP